MRHCKGTFVCVCISVKKSRDKNVADFLEFPEMPEADIANTSI